MEERKRLKNSGEIYPSEENNEKIADLEVKIANEISERYRKDIETTMGHLTAEDGGVSHHGVWKAKSSVVPSDKNNTPVALKDDKGNMITSQEGIKISAFRKY